MEREISGAMFSYYEKNDMKESSQEKGSSPKKPQKSKLLTSKVNDSEYTEFNPVTQDTVWKQSVETEKRGVRQWKENWGFLTEFDSKGCKKSPKSVPENLTLYSTTQPVTNSAHYGARLSTDNGREMQKLEFQFNSSNRKKKIGNDLLCY